ncbi:EutN/CcmL family microcompartment protein [Candidatus Sumerlaeota bacterium]|nr:EutN/CcmL family microcompartment protein [Candidatus Sumerlaeota bacterium]
MLLCRVEGSVISTVKHPSLKGWRLLVCQPISKDGEPEDVPVVAIDPHGAAAGQRVMVSTDGRYAQELVGDPKSPARNTIIGIVDDQEAQA